jgi:CheY-like chemotaxis protein
LSGETTPAGADRSGAAGGTQQAATVLLVEDNEDNILTVADYLTFKSYHVVVARNGREGLEVAIKTEPDLVLMDIQMPELDGLEAIRRLRRMPGFARTPIIALTAMAMAGDRERCFAAGADYYMSKPISLRELSSIIESALLRPDAPESQ